MSNVIPFHKGGMQGLGYGSSYGDPNATDAGGLTAGQVVQDANAAASVIAVGLSAEAASNIINQQNSNANALIALNAQRAAQGMAPLSSLTANMSPLILLGLAAAAFFVMRG